MYKASCKSLRPPTELGKNAVLLRSHIASIRRKGGEMIFYSGGGIHIFEEAWLRCNADARCTVGKEVGETQTDTENFMFKFSCLALKRQFYFITFYPLRVLFGWV